MFRFCVLAALFSSVSAFLNNGEFTCLIAVIVVAKCCHDDLLA